MFPGRSHLFAGKQLLRRLLTAPEHRRLRWILGIGLLIRLILAPLTSWSTDTPGFIESSISLLTLGNPYAAATWFNPPLGVFLSAPFMALSAWIFGINNLVQLVPAAAPLVVATGIDASLIPSPAALLAWKLPLIASDLGVALLLYAIVLRLPGRFSLSATTIAGLWFLNPLVIWASSVHGEVDTLVALFTLLFLIALIREAWLAAGFFFGLDVFAKAYPIFLLPLAIAAVAMWPVPSRTMSWAQHLRRLGLWIVGAGVTALLFLPFLVNTEGLLVTKSGNPQTGGISILGIFNPATPKGSGAYFAFASNPANGLELLGVFRDLAIIGVLAAVLLIGWGVRKSRDHPPADQLPLLALGVTWIFACVLLADSSPEPENLVGLLPFVALSLPLLGRRQTLLLFALLTFAGTLLYWSFVTPLGMFYPLANYLGTGSVIWLNNFNIAYVRVPLIRGLLWLVAGLTGGSALLVLWLLAGLHAVPDAVRRRVRGVFWRGPRVAPTPSE